MIAMTALFLVLLVAAVQSQSVPVSFPTFPANTDIGTCTCDLTASICDVSCCCDSDCSAEDKDVFDCASRSNQYTNSTPILSTIQPTCFKDDSIFRSNSPYVVQKMGELVCIDFARYSGSQYYRQPTVQNVNAGDFIRGINSKSGAVSISALPTATSNYQVGTPLIFFNNVTATPNFYSLPIGLFDSPICSGSQQITYMNDFSSTCLQPVNEATCRGALNPVTYGNSLCLLRSPANPNDPSTYVCGNTTTSSSTFSTSTCTGALQSLTITIFYTNPTGIDRFEVNRVTDTASTSTFRQTFTVLFVKTGSSASATTRNPGYTQGVNLVAGLLNSSTVTPVAANQFALIKPTAAGVCDPNGERIPIRFGENVQSTCLFSASTSCTTFPSLLLPITASNLYVAAYSNSNPVNTTSDWLPVISCTSDIGLPNPSQCRVGVLNFTTCYTRLDIQIAYTKIGTVANPQAVLSAVIFHYQQDTTSTLPRLVTKTVTFQDLSAPPIVVEGKIPTPNTRLPANFFYPFSTSRAASSTAWPSLAAAVAFAIISTFL